MVTAPVPAASHGSPSTSAASSLRSVPGQACGPGGAGRSRPQRWRAGAGDGCGRCWAGRAGRPGRPVGSGPTSGRRRCGRCPARWRRGRRGGQREALAQQQPSRWGQAGVSVDHEGPPSGREPSDSPKPRPEVPPRVNNPDGQYCQRARAFVGGQLADLPRKNCSLPASRSPSQGTS